MKKYSSVAVYALGMVALVLGNFSCKGVAAPETAEYHNIRNDVFWDTAEGIPLYSQGGGIFRYEDPADGVERYFWYGMKYREAALYRENHGRKYPHCTFESVSIYVSDDLVHWHAAGDAITRQELLDRQLPLGWLGRMGVAYVKAAGKYVLMMQHNGSVLVAVSDSPRGPFSYYRSMDMTPYCGTPNTGDQTVFVDPDTNRGYLVYSKGSGRNRTYISEIGLLENDSIGLLDCHQVFQGAGREGNCMFKYKGHYYLCASDLWGWDCSHAYFLKSTDIHGPYEPVGEMRKFVNCERDFSHLTQTGFFYTHRTAGGKETVIYCGDRWADFANNGLGYNQWVPVSFDRDENPVFNSLSSWDFCSATGDWRVAADNNYILNGSFDADRRIIPEPVKPRQAFLTGWDTEFIAGRVVAHEDSLSPCLNRHNSAEDQADVIGKMSLNVADESMPFCRRISQRVEGTAAVPLPDGRYLLRAMVKGGGEAVRCVMFASSQVALPTGGSIASLEVNDGIPVGGASGETLPALPYDLGAVEVPLSEKWQPVEMSVVLEGGRLRAGFEVSGAAGAYCHVDDVTLTMVKD